MANEPAYKLLALDLDGTLITDDLIIAPKAAEAIAQAVARGVVVTLATGRMFALPFSSPKRLISRPHLSVIRAR